MFAAPMLDPFEPKRAAQSVAVACGAIAVGSAVICVALRAPLLAPHFAAAWIERFGAYLAIGALVTLISPRRWPTAVAFVIALAFGLDVGRLYAPGRDAAATDACVKAIGGALGVFSACLAVEIRRRLTGRLGLSGVEEGETTAHDL